MKYLIVICTELSDQFECDCNREPLKVVSNWEKWNEEENLNNNDYEVYEILSNGELKKIKDYDDTTDKGMALYYWHNSDPEGATPTIIQKWAGLTRDDNVPLKAIITLLPLMEKENETTNDLLHDIKSSGAYGISCGEQWLVYGEYENNKYSYGY